MTLISILRLAWLIEYHYGGLFLKPDFSYDIRFVYSTVECNLAIICASIPALSSLLKRWFPKFFARLTKSGGHPRFQSPTFFRNGNNNSTRIQQTTSHVIRTFGGSTIILKNLPASPQASYPRSPLYQNRDGDSDEEGILFGDGRIRKTTKVDVSYNDAISIRSGDVARSASKFRYQQSMRALSSQ